MRIKPRVIVLISFLIIIYSSITYYIGWHLTEWLDAVGITYSPWLFWVPFGMVAYGYILSRITLPLPELIKPVLRLLKVLGSYYIFIIEVGLLLFVIGDLLGLILWFTSVNTENYALLSSSAIIAFVILLLIVGSRNAWSPIVRKYEIDIDKKAVGAHQTWNVAMASDIHLGNVVGRKHLKRLIDRVNAMEPDLILLPGDVIDDSLEPFVRNKMSELLGQLKAKHGVFAVLGNHEYYGGHIDQYVVEMNKVGIKVLQDETVEIAEAVYVVGRKDKTAESMDPVQRLSVSELVSGLDANKPIFLMDHQPTKFAQAADAGADLMLSGHTHRGQFAPNHLFTKRLFELDWGYMKKGAMHVIVSSGFGSWGPPIRIGSRSEIIQLKIMLQS